MAYLCLRTSPRNGRDARLPLRQDLVSELAQGGRAISKGSGDKVFRVPSELVKILKRHLAMAGIPITVGMVGRSTSTSFGTQRSLI